MRTTNILLGIIALLLFLNLLNSNQLNIFSKVFAQAPKPITDVRIVAVTVPAVPVMIGYGKPEERKFVLPIDNSGDPFGTEGNLAIPVRTISK